MTGLIQDLRYAFRQLRKSPGFTTAAVATLALGIGVNLTMFVILYGVLVRPLSFPDPHQVVRMERFFPDGELVPSYSGTKVLFILLALGMGVGLGYSVFRFLYLQGKLPFLEGTAERTDRHQRG